MKIWTVDAFTDKLFVGNPATAASVDSPLGGTHPRLPDGKTLACPFAL